MPNKVKTTPASRWRDEYDDIEDDKASHQEEIPDVEGDNKERDRRREVDMAELLRTAKVKESKLNSGYEFLASPASKVVTPADEAPRPGEQDEEWVEVDAEDSGQTGESSRRRYYSKAVTEGKDKA